MEALILKRNGIRGRIDNLDGVIRQEIEKDNPDENKLYATSTRYQRYYDSMQEINKMILDKMAEDNRTPEEVDAEMAEADQVEAKIQECIIILNQRFPNTDNQAEVDRQSAIVAAEVVKLPKKSIPKYDGKLTTWLSWWNAFEVVHNHPTLSDKAKFDYLMEALAEGSRAMQCAQTYPQTGDNYAKAIAALKERFGDEDDICDALMTDVLDLGYSQEKLPLVQLYDKLEGKLLAMQSLGRTLETEMLYLVALRCLNKKFSSRWKRFYAPLKMEKKNEMRSRLVIFMEWLRQESKHEDEGGNNLDRKRTYEEGVRELVPTTAQLFHGVESKRPKIQGRTGSCAFCDQPHETKDCFSSRNLTLQQRRDKLMQKRLCFTCFHHSHRQSDCRSQVKCQRCHGRHYLIMCPKNVSGSEKQSSRSSFTPWERSTSRRFNKPGGGKDAAPSTSSNRSGGTVINTLNSAGIDMVMKEVPLQTLMVKLLSKGREKVVRALLDPGSQRSTILTRTALELGMDSVQPFTLAHKLYGDLMDYRKHSIYRAEVTDLTGKKRLQLNVLDDVKIVSGIPKYTRLSSDLGAVGVSLTDCDGSSDIELLLGNDVYGLILTGRKELGNGLVALNTLFGWVLSGEIQSGPDAALVSISLVNNCSVKQLWDLDMLGIKDPIEVKSRRELDEDIKQHFIESVCRTSNGRYVIKLPWVMDRGRLMNNYSQALKRLAIATAKLQEGGYYAKYEEIFQDWMRLGIIEEVQATEVTRAGCYYLPHRAVIKTSSLTMKIRPVFDASCRTASKLSLNDCLAKGPNMLELIPNLVTRFRLRAFGVVSDIEKAFLQISVHEEDRDVLRFLWWEKDATTTKIYRHRRVVFGVNSSPFQLSAVIENHLLNIKDERERVAIQLLRHLYVDNCIISLDSKEEIAEFQLVATQLMLEAKMNLRLWMSNVDVFKNGEDSSVMVLGLEWDRKTDVLAPKMSKIVPPALVTKRSILAASHSIFDPMGIMSPVLILPKLMLREICLLKLGWDDEVSEDLSCKFQKWCQELQLLAKLQIPRRVADVNPSDGRWELHVFSDASKDAYATVVFVRVTVGATTTVRLLQAKSRVAPLNATIPRLELLACLIGARLGDGIRTMLSDAGVHCDVTYWTDSSTALTWIRKEDAWGVFVNNRVTEIRKLTSIKTWRFVPGGINPADLPSRGCSAKHLLKSQWWTGPEWLKTVETWPQEVGVVDLTIVNKECRKSVAALVSIATTVWYLRSSSYHRNLRIMAYVRRWRHVSSQQRHLPLGVDELYEAERVIWKLVQEECQVSNKSVNLHLEKHVDSGLWIVTTRMPAGSCSDSRKNPVYLPKDHPVVMQMVAHFHQEHHAPVLVVVNKLREQVWIPGLTKIAKTVVRRCVVCRRFQAKNLDAIFAPLPIDRVTAGRCFATTGIDLGGPLILKNGDKAWIVLFTCGVYRCVHLELVLSLSTAAFLQALRRFIARRGRPRTIYSDNGTNFVGTENLLRQLDWTELRMDTQAQKIRWKFNPPTAAWWGGWWERLVGLVKGLLRRKLGKAAVNFTELVTILCDIECVLNERPLTTVTDDMEDLSPLTPSMFMAHKGEVEVPDLDAVERSLLQGEFVERQKVLEDLRERFVKEYLSELIQFKRKIRQAEVKVGDVVLVGSDNVKRIYWPLARVIELLPGKDGVCRLVRLRMRTGGRVTGVLRPIQRIYPLELSQEGDALPNGQSGIEEQQQRHDVEKAGNGASEQDDVTVPLELTKRKKLLSCKVDEDDFVIKTRSGRVVKAPERLAYCFNGFELL